MTRKIKTPGLALSGLIALGMALANEVSGQADGEPGGGLAIHVELDGGFAVGSHSASAAGLETKAAPSYGATVGFRVTPNIGVFAGYMHTSYGCENGYCQQVNPTISADHGTAGVEYGFGKGWVRLGAAYGVSKGTPSERTALPPSEPTDPALAILGMIGTTLGTGRFSVRPSITYLRFGADDVVSGSGHGTALSGKLGFRYQISG